MNMVQHFQMLVWEGDSLSTLNSMSDKITLHESRKSQDIIRLGLGYSSPVEYLPSMNKTLASIFSIIKKKKTLSSKRKIRE